MPKLQPGGTLPVRNLPSTGKMKPDEVKVPEHYLEWILTEVHRKLQSIEAYHISQSQLVEESAGDSYEEPTGETSLRVVAEYSPASERISEILVTGPVSTAFTLQLGSAYMKLATDANGKCLLAPVSFTLKPDDQRLMTTAVNGSWYIHMSGYALTVKATT